MFPALGKHVQSAAHDVDSGSLTRAGRVCWLVDCKIFRHHGRVDEGGRIGEGGDGGKQEVGDTVAIKG